MKRKEYPNLTHILCRYLKYIHSYHGKGMHVVNIIGSEDMRTTIASTTLGISKQELERVRILLYLNTFLKIFSEVTVMAQSVNDPACLCRGAGLIPGQAQRVKGLVLLWLGCGSPMQLGFDPLAGNLYVPWAQPLKKGKKNEKRPLEKPAHISGCGFQPPGRDDVCWAPVGRATWCSYEET